MSSRVDGRKVVGFAFVGITMTLGFAQIYLPFIADRDKLRGMFEEDDMPESAKRELDTMMKVEQAAKDAEAASNARTNNHQNNNTTNTTAGAGSMWKNFRRG